MTRRALAGVLLLVGTALGIAGCSSIDTGVITKKTYEEGYYYYTSQCYSYDKNGLCIVSMPVQHYEDPDYKFDLRNGDEEGWVYVSEGEYHQYEVGDYYGRGPDNKRSNF